MEIKIPDKIQVGGHEYRVVYRDDLDRTERWRGTANHVNLSIEIDSHEEGTRLMSTFLHELLHSVDKIYNCAAIPEEGIDAISEGLTQALQSMGIKFVR